MIAIRFSKQFAEEVRTAVQNGRPIVPPRDPDTGAQAWSGNNLLTLVGVLTAAVQSQGPHTLQAPGTDPAAAKAKMPTEHREAVDEVFLQDVHNAIDFLSHLASAVYDDEYDEEYEETIGAMLSGNADGGTTVVPVRGFKNVSGPLDR